MYYLQLNFTGNENTDLLVFYHYSGYCSAYVTLLSILLHKHNLYQHIYYFYYVQSALPPLFSSFSSFSASC